MVPLVTSNLWAEIRLRILNDQFAEQVAMKKALRKYQVIQKDRRHTISNVGNTLGLSPVTFDGSIKIEVDCCRIRALIC